MNSLKIFHTQRWAQYARSRNGRCSQTNVDQTVRLNAWLFPWYAYISSRLYTLRFRRVREGQRDRRGTCRTRGAVRAMERESHARREETRFIRYKPAAVGFRTTSYAFPDIACVCAQIHARAKYHCVSVLRVKKRFFDFFARRVLLLRLNSAWRHIV